MNIIDNRNIKLSELAVGDSFFYAAATQELLCVKMDTVDGVDNTYSFTTKQKIKLTMATVVRRANASVVVQ